MSLSAEAVDSCEFDTSSTLSPIRNVKEQSDHKHGRSLKIGKKDEPLTFTLVVSGRSPGRSQSADAEE